ncbi:hypothetical protein QCA50_008777 [Cerrena zonata]|uniref:Fungal-type protein kinase domain-containing protein n=1 Tax=Cerrena zonata TaxID=2478898 RepID=A0AAW0GEI9_9APHY
MSGYAIGPIPPQTFLNRFLPTQGTFNRRVRKDTFKDVPSSYDGVNERYMCRSFATVMNDKKFCPNRLFVATTSSVDENHAQSKVSAYPNIAVYPTGVTDKNWSSMELFLQVKPEEYFDPYREEFSSEDDGLENPSDLSSRARDELFTYASLQMGYQFRLFTFAVGIYGSRARFFRFDPSACSVSASFNYHENPKMLADFFLRYNTLAFTQRGFDPTAFPATEEEKELYRSHIKDYLARTEHENLRRYPEIEQTGDGSFPITKVQVTDLDGSQHWYLICKPSSIPFNLASCGRLTRGFIAVPTRSPACDRYSMHNYDSSTSGDQKGKLYWLKDCWRPANGESESSIYRYLAEKNVPNLPEVVCGGDVEMDGEIQETENDSFLTDPNAIWRRPTGEIQHMVHHRIVQGLLIPLWYAESAKELLRAGRDALTTIAGAFHDARVLHQDLSVGNIMLTENRSDGARQSAVLNDWDRAKRIDFDSNKHHIGTWEFASVELLREGQAPHEAFDDLESIMWVLLFIAIRRFNYEGDFHMEMFDEVHPPYHATKYKGRSGGLYKSWWLTGGVHGDFVCDPLNTFFVTYRTIHEERRKKTKLARDSKTQDAKDDLERYKAEIQEDLYAHLVFFDDILDDPAADWSDSVPVPFAPEPKIIEEIATRSDTVSIQPIQLRRSKRHRRDPIGSQNDDSRPQKRVTIASNGADGNPRNTGPSRKGQTAKVIPRKTYNLRLRRK